MFLAIVISFSIGAVCGCVAGILIYRNNKRKAEEIEKKALDISGMFKDKEVKK